MRFFTREIIENTMVYKPGYIDKEYINACDSYRTYFETVKDKFPKKFVDLFSKNYFHDDNMIDFAIIKKYHRSSSNIEVKTVWKDYTGKIYMMKFLDVKYLNISLDLKSYSEIGDNLACEATYEDGLYGFDVLFHDTDKEIFIKSRKMQFKIIG